MTIHNEPTFELCPHDRENPYKQISRALIQDRSISPKAKGVLIYLLSLPKDWKIHHSQLQYGLNIGEDYLNSAMDELIKAGYADRTRERVKGIFQPYRYKIREFKKCSPNRKTPNGVLSDTPDGENRPGSSGPENPAIQKTETTSTEETATEKPKSAAAVFPEKTPEKTKPKIYPILDLVDIPIHDKEEITRKYAEDVVSYAVSFCTEPGFELKTSLAAAIKWACKVKPEESGASKERKRKLEQQTEKNEKIKMYCDNKAYAQRYHGMKAGAVEISLWEHGVYFRDRDKDICTSLIFSVDEFMAVFTHMLRKNKFKALEES